MPARANRLYQEFGNTVGVWCAKHSLYQGHEIGCGATLTLESMSLYSHAVRIEWDEPSTSGVQGADQEDVPLVLNETRTMVL